MGSMLHCQVLRDGEFLGNYDALNDVVVHQSEIARITDFDVRVNGTYVANYKADGLIIATPTGSTAYSLAAGGPVLSPDLPGFVITPVAPHALTNRPLVVPDSVIIEVRMQESGDRALRTVNGRTGVSLLKADVRQCSKSKL